MIKKYSSVTNWPLIALMLGMTAAPIVAGIILLPNNLKQGGVLLGVGGFNLALFLLLVLPCVYTLSEETLEIRSGVILTPIPLSTITHAEIVTEPTSVPALSFRRVKVTYGDQHALLAPKNREAFLADLRAAMSAARHRAAT